MPGKSIVKVIVLHALQGGMDSVEGFARNGRRLPRGVENPGINAWAREKWRSNHESPFTMRYPLSTATVHLGCPRVARAAFDPWLKNCSSFSLYKSLAAEIQQFVQQLLSRGDHPSVASIHR